MFIALISSSRPPPTWKLCSEMLKKPGSAQAGITQKALKAAVRIVLRRGARPK